MMFVYRAINLSVTPGQPHPCQQIIEEVRQICVFHYFTNHVQTKTAVTTTIRFRLDSHSIAVPPRYDHSTTYTTTVGLPV